MIVVAPLPFGSVGRGGRLTVEILALSLTALWAALAIRHTVRLPPRPVQIALVGLLTIATVQLIPLGNQLVSVVSPKAAMLRQGLDPVPDATLSLAPSATASALRTGAALVGLVFVATSVVAVRG
jgi:hypothetical protein